MLTVYEDGVGGDGDVCEGLPLEPQIKFFGYAIVIDDSWHLLHLNIPSHLSLVPILTSTSVNSGRKEQLKRENKLPIAAVLLSEVRQAGPVRITVCSSA